MKRTILIIISIVMLTQYLFVDVNAADYNRMGAVLNTETFCRTQYLEYNDTVITISNEGLYYEDYSEYNEA